MLALLALLCWRCSAAWLTPRFKHTLATTAAATFLLGCPAPPSLQSSLPTLALVLPAHAKDVPATATIWKSGKNPRPVNPSDPKVGSKKDSSFLKCLSSCKQDCQKPSAGLAKGDCVQDCQDQCCTTYEQCSFKIKSNTGNEI